MSNRGSLQLDVSACTVFGLGKPGSGFGSRNAALAFGAYLTLATLAAGSWEPPGTKARAFFFREVGQGKSLQAQWKIHPATARDAP